MSSSPSLPTTRAPYASRSSMARSAAAGVATRMTRNAGAAPICFAAASGTWAEMAIGTSSGDGACRAPA